MSSAPRGFAPRSWLRRPRTARTRLTLLYFGLFLALGTLLLAATYLFAEHSSSVSVAAVHAVVHATRGLGPAAGPVNRLLATPLQGLQDGAVAEHTADQARLLTVSWVALLVAAALASVLGWLSAGRVLRPVRQISSRAREISAGNLHRRLALDGPNDEFKQLGDTLDDLLARLEASFESQRRFVANASHELRTPLTLERTLLEVALADPNASAETLRATCRELLASGRDQERLLESLLTLTSSERGLEHTEPLELDVIAERAVASAPASPVRVEAELHPATTSGDPALAERLVANLLDNAIAHNVPDGSVTIRTATDDGQPLLSVSNTGPIIPEHELERLFEPFQRLEGDRLADRDGHHGLGLSIVRAIANAHNATVDARPRPAGGLDVTVRFPARA